MRSRLLLSVFFLLLICAAPLSAETTSVVTQKQSAKDKTQKSPMGALLRSVAFPGWGQFYNGKYVKSAIVFGAETFFIIKAVHWWDKTEKQYKVVENTDLSLRAKEAFLFQSYRGRRNDYLWLVGLTVFVSMFDAYVDAHLSGFDIDLTPDFSANNRTVMLQATIRF